jgi:hypothetical protein
MAAWPVMAEQPTRLPGPARPGRVCRAGLARPRTGRDPQGPTRRPVRGCQLPLILGYVLAYTVVYANGVYGFYHLLGFIPFTAPVVMPVLVAVGAAPAWQMVLSVAITLASTVAMARLAGKIYERAILRTGSRLHVRQVLRSSS